MNAEVEQDRGFAGQKEVTWKGLSDSSDAWRQSHGLSTPVAAFGWIVITGLVKKHAPEMVASLLAPEVAAGAGAAGFLAVVFYDWTVRCTNAAVKANFVTDETRRMFDRSNPLTGNEVKAGT